MEKCEKFRWDEITDPALSGIRGAPSRSSAAPGRWCMFECSQERLEGHNYNDRTGAIPLDRKVDLESNATKSAKRTKITVDNYPSGHAEVINGKEDIDLRTKYDSPNE